VKAKAGTETTAEPGVERETASAAAAPLRLGSRSGGERDHDSDRGE
jgi:hypothetical protein